MKKIKKIWAIVCLFLLWLQPLYPLFLIGEVWAAPITPTASPVGTTYNQLQNVILTPGLDAVETYYSIGESEPDTNSIYYNIGDTIPIDANHGENVVLNAISYDIGGSASPIMTETYTFDKQGPEAPTANFPSNVYNHALSVGISVANDATHTFYNVGNSISDPGLGSTEYTVGATIPIDEVDGNGVNLKIISYDSVGNASLVSTYSYIFDKEGPVAPTANVASGIYGQPLSVILTLDSVNAISTYYNVGDSNVSDPNSSSTVYGVGDTINIDGIDGQKKYLKAISYDAVNNPSGIAIYEYTFDTSGPNAPTPDVATGTYNHALSVGFSLDVGGSATHTYYTLDNSAPSNIGGTEYFSGDFINIDGNTGETIYLKAVSYDNAGNIGETSTTAYSFDKTPPTDPTANIATGEYNHSLNIGFTVSGDTDRIYYTIGGSNPDLSSNWIAIGSTIAIDGADNTEVILKAAAHDAVGNLSGVASYTYTFDKLGPIGPIASINSGTFNHAINIGLTIDQLDAINTYYSLNGIDPSDVVGTLYSIGNTITIDGNTETKVLKAISYDHMGNGTTNTYSYTFDNLGPDAPTVNIVEGSYNHGLGVILTPAGDAVSTYFTLNGNTPSNVGSTLYGIGNTIPIDGNNGQTKTLKSVSYDSLGNIGNSMVVNYFFDKQAPSVIGISDNTIPARTATWNWDANEQNSTFRFVVDQTSTGVPTGVYSNTKTNTLTIGNGTYYIHIQAKDSAGNESVVKTGRVVLDNTPPSIPTNLDVNPTSPTNQIQQGWKWGISTDNMVGLKGYRYWITNSDNGTSIVSDTAIGETAVVTNLNTGNYIFNVGAEDNLGNVSIGATKAYIVDARIPEITVISPKQYLTVTNDLNLLINTDVSTTCTFIFDDQTEITMLNTGGVNHSHQLTGLSAGNHNVLFNCTNYLGTVGSVFVGFNSGNQTGNVLDASLTGANIGSTVAGVGELPNGISTLQLSNSSDITFRNLSTGSSGIINIGGDDFQLNSFTSGDLNEQDLTSGVNVQNQNVLVNKAISFESGIDGSPIVLTNKDLASVSAIIPDGTVIMGPDSWDGTLMGPKSNSNSTEFLPAGFMIGDVAIEIGSNNNTLIFDRPVKIEFKNKIGDFSYKATGDAGWTKMNTCQGNYSNPVMSPFAGECSIDNGIDTIIYTYHFTAFAQIKGIPGYVNPDWNVSQKNDTPVCSDQKPSSKPSLFRIDATNTSAKLFFAPAGNPNSYYFVAYGEFEGDERYGVRIDGQSSGVMSYAINSLKPNSTYFFKVRGGNGCTTGDWSNNMWIKTNKKASSFFAVGQKSLVAKTISKIASIGKKAKAAPIITPRIITELPSVNNISPETQQPVPTKRNEGVVEKMSNFFKSIFGK